MTPLRQRMINDMQIRHLSSRTIRTYTDHVAKFAQHFGRSPVNLPRFGGHEVYAACLSNCRSYSAGLR